MTATGTPIRTHIGTNIGDPHFCDLLIGEWALILTPMIATAAWAVLNHHWGLFLSRSSVLNPHAQHNAKT